MNVGVIPLPNRNPLEVQAIENNQVSVNHPAMKMVR